MLLGFIISLQYYSKSLLPSTVFAAKSVPRASINCHIDWFGVAASLDALLVGITYGIHKIHIQLQQNIVISLITLLGTCLSILLGTGLEPILPNSLGQRIGSIILILLGAYYVIKHSITAFQKDLSDKQCKEALMITTCESKPKNPIFPENTALKEQLPRTLSFTESCILGFTLSLNNMGIGLSASIAGLGFRSATIVTFACSVLFLLTGNYLGCNYDFPLNEKAADPASGLLLIPIRNPIPYTKPKIPLSHRW